MRILDRYILKSVFSVFFTCLLTFVLLYVIIDAFYYLQEILKQKIGLSDLLRYYLAYLPIIFVQVSAIACLLATLYTFGILNRNNEIIAMRSSGLSIFQISKMVLIFGVVVSLLVFWVNDRFVPVSLSLTQNMKERLESGAKEAQAKKQDLIANVSMYGLKNRLYFVNRFLVNTNTMEGITILEHDERQNITKKIVANKGVYKDGLWRFYQSITYEFDENGQIKAEPRYFDEEIMTITETPRDFLAQRQRPDFMTIAQLQDYIWKLSQSGATGVIRNFKVDLYQRFTAPLASLMMILLGIPFSLSMRRRATGLSSLGLAIMMGFLYYVLNAVSVAFGKAGFLTPFLSASLPYILAASYSLYLIDNLP
ncbi:LPS export ABC transporter permease LptG [bacterium]|nr:MAG: LPS export ABC transporter permease LptG [bacterium]